jgi:hypothetical protein
MALLPPFFLDAVLAIGIENDKAERKWIGTGFLYGSPVPKPHEGNPQSYRLWLVTNRHVLESQRRVFLKFNSTQDNSSEDYPVELVTAEGRMLWVGHQKATIDVAAIWLNAEFLHENKRRFAFFQADKHCMTRIEMNTQGLTEGDRCFVLGYPMGLVSPQRQYVICRGGVIARIRDYLDGHATDYLVDATVFPGNSGGPVILCPSALAIHGTQPIGKSALIGIVKAYVSYTDTAVSPQTGRPRITFEENSGLSSVESLDAIAETVAKAERDLLEKIAERQPLPEQAEVTPNQTRNTEDPE